jgi:hypothetical protein
MMTIAMSIRSVDWSGKLEPMSVQLHVNLFFAFPWVKMNSYALTPIYINIGRQTQTKNDALNSTTTTTTTTTTTATTTTTTIRITLVEEFNLLAPEFYI